jgi:hypothetical protein
MRRGVAASLGVTVFLLPGCVLVPDLEPTTKSIPVYEIVERVKCELIAAVREPLEDAEANPKTSPYWFLPDWNAGVDLTLVVNDQAGVSPSVSFVQPLTLASLAGRVTNMPRSASLGVGAGVNTQAIRTEKMSFALTLKKVIAEVKAHPDPYHFCEFPFGTDLTSDDLGLKEWVRSAFSPLDPPDTPGYPLLKEGAPAPAAPGGGGPKQAKLQADFMTKAENIVPLLTQSGATDTALGGQAYTTTKEVLKQPKNEPLRSNIFNNNLEVLKQLNSDLQSPNGKVNTQSQLTIQNKAAPEEAAKTKDAIARLKSAVPELLALGNQLQKTKPAPIKPTPSKTPLPPISALSHQVQFIVTWNANANPSWTLLHFKGPSAGSGSFFSAQQINTHTLTITLGPPPQGGGPGLGTEATALRTSQQFNAAFQTLAPQLMLPP